MGSGVSRWVLEGLSTYPLYFATDLSDLQEILADL
jgi:hypothetical protein